MPAQKEGGWRNGNPIHLWDCSAGGDSMKSWRIGDTNDPLRNATVRIEGSTLCSGVLVARDLVLMAGHCFKDHSTKPQEQTDQFSNQDWEIPGKWYPLPVNIMVRIGSNDSRGGTTYQATEYTVPGHADIMMLRLKQDVSLSRAFPAEIITTQIPLHSGADIREFFRGKFFRFSGWGRFSDGSLPQFRKTISDFGFSRYPASFGGETKADRVEVLSSARLKINGGDSGSPLYLEQFPIIRGHIQQQRSSFRIRRA